MLRCLLSAGARGCVGGGDDGGLFSPCSSRRVVVSLTTATARGESRQFPDQCRGLLLRLPSRQDARPMSAGVYSWVSVSLLCVGWPQVAVQRLDLPFPSSSVTQGSPFLVGRTRKVLSPPDRSPPSHRPLSPRPAPLTPAQLRLKRPRPERDASAPRMKRVPLLSTAPPGKPP